MDDEIPNLATNISPALRYSSLNWDRHLPDSTDSPPLRATLSEFLVLPALFWIEAMHLLGADTQCDRMLWNACKWVKEVSYAPAFRGEFEVPRVIKAKARASTVRFEGLGAAVS